ncbi:MAG: transglutaminase-like domain-containing protein [Thermodesulfobacteriota bacterium]
MRRPSFPLLGRIALLLAWLLLLGLLVKRDLFVPRLNQREAEILAVNTEESWLGVYFSGKRIGYVRSRLRPDPASDGLRLEQTAFLRLNILGESHPVRMELTAGLSRASLLRDFSFSLASPLYQNRVRGRVEGNTIHFSMQTGKESMEDSITLARPPLLATSQRGYLLRQGMRSGDQLTVPYFDPVSLAVQEARLEYRGQEKVVINNRVYLLHRFVESFSGVRISSWLDDAGKVVKEESAAGFVFLAEPKFQAMAVGEGGDELLGAVAVPLVGTAPDLGRAVLRYRLTLPAEAEVELEGGRQHVEGDLLVVRRETVPSGSAVACDAPSFLAASPYLQADHREIADLARSLAGQAPSAIAKVRALAGWVHANLEKRPVIGVPDAVTTLRSRQGDCNEHAVLLAALCRSIGIPARVAAGVTLRGDAFYYHAWNEVCIDGQWLSLDTTVNQLPADLGHIRLVTGETKEMLKIAGLLGRLRIEAVETPPGGEGTTP